MTDGQVAGGQVVDGDTKARPWHLWAVGVLSLLWNSGGAFDYTMTKTRNADYLAGFPPETLAFVERIPVWANIPWALGVWGAVAGSILLLARSRWAVPAFAVSLAGLAGSTFYQYGVADMPASMTTGGSMAFSAALWAVAGFLLWYAMRMRTRGVLR